MSQFETELLRVLALFEWVVSRGVDFKNLKLFRILGVYSGFFAFIGAHK